MPTTDPTPTTAAVVHLPTREERRARARTAHPAGTARDADRHRQLEHVVATLVRAWFEVRDGVRPYPQLAAHLAPTLAHRLAQEIRQHRHRPSPRPRIRSVHVAPPTPSGAREATALLEQEPSGRVSALAVRLERHRSGWRVTELAAPDAGYGALSTASSPSTPVRDAFDEAAAEAEARERRQVACERIGPDAAHRLRAVHTPAPVPPPTGAGVVVELSPRRRGSA